MKPKTDKAGEGLACLLNKQDLAQRKATILTEMKAAIMGMEERENGYCLQFPGHETMLENLVQVIRKERECCPFLTFELKVEKKESPIWLTISGPEGTQAFLKSELGLMA